MRYLATFLLILFMFGTMGCAMHQNQAQADLHDALHKCRTEADKKYRSRYTHDWNNFVNDCMNEKGFSDQY